ncbi:type VI secretion system ATPase TssH [Bradyrhizobium sp. U87765 SZCCT0131]|uniref:type VI secretion system ATPase TssH n=1 Tax=unclassified Bradyrhizobium TaxID=2631580 RepID=UPI001BA86DBF|nr:type VI secretion system ATPase TssH [Bradyrhizobium sp. U87765 SZCCT0131]MBR1263099.1 type VI secretion system ATPase TssH [Bradyrhizobium sp. U87765 SZCCT0134]MBR1307018.1 type VI secretion system ATPase TssH [Bradyrhizobium sp. U87765 SZCCT0110]MBR1323094.1 type VI secretion system ATPase TssH [Bradyrhizobium sp. U87765 SZCCT0109]MBR1345972.1 type VI secretion system ATPase TssH [Bradyrhizobium sp. U87765 SZCCT0048]
MTDISLETVTGKLNRAGYDAFIQALRHAKSAGNRNVELAHWLFHILQQERTDLSLTADHYKLDRARLLSDLAGAITGFRKNETDMPGIANGVVDILDRGWHYATLFFGEAQIRTGHLIVAGLKSNDLRRTLAHLSQEFAKVNVDALAAEHRAIWAGSEEDNLRPMDGSGLAGAGTPGAEQAAGPKGTTPLDRYSQDLTAKAKSGEMDPILGRDNEIRQLIDVLMRRRQNNPILTGEAGVGKTAVVEGFAQRIAAGDVPPPLRGVRLCALDIGLMQAGASMKGEFEQRLRSVIDEVQSSPTPIILFIDEAHTLIGAGGAAGTGDAANLLKPPLARGTLRTIAATTWAEYRQYIEKDPALTRRFQPINVDEPDVETCCIMLRGLIGPMEKHHGVRISDAAIVAAVNLSHRYIPARQLPDKAVSLLDTAAARVAISQSATPALIEDARVAIAAREAERTTLVSDGDLGVDDAERIAAIDGDIAGLKTRLAGLEADWATEQALVTDIRSLREILADPKDSEDPAARRAELRGKFETLEGITPDRRMIYPHVDEQSVASVVSDWTGIPVGRMVRDEIETVLKLPEILNRRVVGQSHGLSMIAKRIETSRAKLDNPSKPIGVFMLAGPSGVGKTETALALAEALYGGEQNMIAINMSEFQEAHTVSTLKGAPPGYVGYGEGGRLTEAVRRKPYSVILLDEVEKAHPDVHEIFFQVFDKGIMEDGTGRKIDFKNTLIILTTNVGTDLIMGLSRDPRYRDDPEELARLLRPELLKVFPPALLGRIVSIPYFPLSGDMLAGIVRLQLDRIGRRIRDNHDAAFSYDDAVVDHIVARCNDPDSGGRMIDNIITNTLLPELSREFLNRSLAKDEITQARVSIADDRFAYAWQ